MGGGGGCGAPHPALARGVPPLRQGRPHGITCSVRVLRGGWAWARPRPSTAFPTRHIVHRPSAGLHQRQSTGITGSTSNHQPPTRHPRGGPLIPSTPALPSAQTSPSLRAATSGAHPIFLLFLFLVPPSVPGAAPGNSAYLFVYVFCLACCPSPFRLSPFLTPRWGLDGFGYSSAAGAQFTVHGGSLGPPLGYMLELRL